MTPGSPSMRARMTSDSMPPSESNPRSTTRRPKTQNTPASRTAVATATATQGPTVLMPPLPPTGHILARARNRAGSTANPRATRRSANASRVWMLAAAARSTHELEGSGT
jgi:hypothetical protein